MTDPKDTPKLSLVRWAGGKPNLLEKVRARLLNNIVIDENGCWLWQRAKMSGGYASIYLGPKLDKSGGISMRGHRVSYELYVGPIPDDLVPDHLCRVRHCVNYAHLELVTVQENLMRGETLAAANAAKTVCPRCGQPYRINPAGRRRCLPCESRNDTRTHHGRKEVCP